jgi:hypothetical protein
MGFTGSFEEHTEDVPDLRAMRAMGSVVLRLARKVTYIVFGY